MRFFALLLRGRCWDPKLWIEKWQKIGLLALIILGLPAVVFSDNRTLLDRFALYPSTEPLAEGSNERKLLPSGLEVWIHRRPALRTSDRPRHFFIIHFIGNASRAEVETPGFNLLPLFPNDVEIEVWSVNYPGYGGSTGQATLKSFPPTALDVYDTLRKTTEASSIIISGNSIGTMAALYLATERPSKAVILRNPIPLRELILEGYGWWNLWLIAGPIAAQIPAQLNSIENVAKVTAPILFLTSEKDSIIPPHLQRKIVNQYKGHPKHIILEGIDHNDEIPPQSFQRTRQALVELLQ